MNDDFYRISDLVGTVRSMLNNFHFQTDEGFLFKGCLENLNHCVELINNNLKTKSFLQVSEKTDDTLRQRIDQAIDLVSNVEKQLGKTRDTAIRVDYELDAKIMKVASDLTEAMNRIGLRLMALEGKASQKPQLTAPLGSKTEDDLFSRLEAVAKATHTIGECLERRISEIERRLNELDNNLLSRIADGFRDIAEDLDPDD